MQKVLIRLAAFGIALVTATTGYVAEPDALRIMLNVHERPVGKDQTGELTMELINPRGTKRVRTIRQFWKDFGDTEKKVMFFLAPADVRGTAFMNWSYDAPGKDEDKWIFLPALKRVTRIAGDGGNDYFMGSDFTYDDLGSRHPSRDRHAILRTETLGGEDCHVVESRPIDPAYMYSRTVSWIIKDKWIGLKREFYDRNGKLLKVLTVEEHQRINGFWIITTSRMHNVQRNHTTLMKLSGVRVNSGVPDRNFTTGAMERGVQ
jgi:outer membrane lipoprotein-sorting protein